jgi:hypothetical protein
MAYLSTIKFAQLLFITRNHVIIEAPEPQTLCLSPQADTQGTIGAIFCQHHFILLLPQVWLWESAASHFNEATGRQRRDTFRVAQF